MDTIPTSVEFSRLVPGDAVNARSKADRNVGIDELAALIKHKGLLQPLVVRPFNGSKFQVTAGNRRLRAIGKMIEAKDWPADKPVPITFRDEDDRSAAETSLIENIGRLPMHAVDQFEAFAELHAKGSDEDEIAARYGIETRVVRQQLALGRLAPSIRKAWRAGEIDAKTAQAFAVCPDKKLQAKTFQELSQGNRSPDEYSVKQALTNDRPKLSDPRVRFVGLGRYRSAGGEVVENLFGDDGYLSDGMLLKDLVNEVCKQRCEELVADGWSWAIPASELKGVHVWNLKKLKPKTDGLEPDDKKRLEAIKKEDAALDDQRQKLWDREKRGEDTEDEQDAIVAKEDELRAEADDIRSSALARAFSPSQKAKAGCVIEIGDDDAKITYGVLRETNTLKREPPRPDPVSGPAEQAEGAEAGLSQALMQSVTETLTVAAARAMETDPEIALRVAIAALSVDTEFGWQNRSPAKLSGKGHSVVRGGGEADDDSDGDLDDEDSLFSSRLLSYKTATHNQALGMLASHVARSLDLVRVRGGEIAKNVATLISVLPGEAFLRFARETFDPADFFARAPGRVAEAAIAEIVAFDRAELEPTMPKKKAELATLAATKAKRLGWLPIELRHPDYALLGAAPAKSKKARAKATA